MQLHIRNFKIVFLVLSFLAATSPAKAALYDSYTQDFYLSGVLATGAALSLAYPPELTNRFRILKGILGLLILHKESTDMLTISTMSSSLVTSRLLFFAAMKSYIGISLLLNSIFGKRSEKNAAQEKLQKSLDKLCQSIESMAQQYTKKHTQKKELV